MIAQTANTQMLASFKECYVSHVVRSVQGGLGLHQQPHAALMATYRRRVERRLSGLRVERGGQRPSKGEGTGVKNEANPGISATLCKDHARGILECLGAESQMAGKIDETVKKKQKAGKEITVLWKPPPRHTHTQGVCGGGDAQGLPSEAPVSS